MSSGWTAVYVATEYGIIGYIEELPGAHAQGATIEETQPRLREALEMMLRANRRITREDFKSARVVKRERLSFTVATLCADSRRLYVQGRL